MPSPSPYLMRMRLRGKTFPTVLWSLRCRTLSPAAALRRYDRPANGVIARNVIEGGFGLYRMEGCAGVIMEDNVMRGAGLNTYGSWVSTYYSKATEGSCVSMSALFIRSVLMNLIHREASNVMFSGFVCFLQVCTLHAIQCL
jgi:hypothetical protein